ncbi:MAG: hypothetical protein U0746_00745 [Gemmataceae bacterium]
MCTSRRPPTGYATGLAVLALRRAGIWTTRGSSEPSRARRQRCDGTWPINYLNKSRDPKDNVGKFMRDAATGFAVLLTEPKRSDGPSGKGPSLTLPARIQRNSSLMSLNRTSIGPPE